MKKLIYCLISACVILSVNSCSKEDITGKKLRIICEELRPYSYVENDELKGLSVEIVGGIGSLMELREMSVEITTDWGGAMDILRTEDNVALFTTGLTTNRKDDFQWVGPIAMFIDGFMGLKSSGLDVTSINEAKELPSVGVVTGYSSTETLEKKDFENLVYFNTLNEAISALYAGTISTLFDVTYCIHAEAVASGRDVEQLTEVFNYSTTQAYIAFSAGVSPKLVESWQDKLDQMKERGDVQDIYDQYLPGVKAPGLLAIYTEENPPQNYRDDTGSVTGSSFDMVEAMMEIIEREEPVTLTTWNDGYDQVLLAPNSMIFSTTRTPARESLFHWVGPICKKNYCFYVRSASSIELNVIDDAKLLGSIGVPEGWAAEQELEDLGFTNIQTWSTPEKVFQKLMNGKVDAVVLNDISIEYLAGQTGYSPDDVRNELLLSAGESYLAFALDTKAEYIQEWEQAYTTIINNGTFEEIWHQWYPDIDW